MGSVSKYSLTPEQYDAIKESQGGLCKLCRGPQQQLGWAEVPELDVDHDKRCCPGATSCGACVRGLLCRSCNRLVGRVEAAPFTYDELGAYMLLAKGVV